MAATLLAYSSASTLVSKIFRIFSEFALLTCHLPSGRGDTKYAPFFCVFSAFSVGSEALGSGLDSTLGSGAFGVSSACFSSFFSFLRVKKPIGM